MDQVLQVDERPEVPGLVGGPRRAHCYVISCRRTGDTVVLDPDDDAARIAAVVGRQLVAVLLTHAQSHHVQVVNDIRTAHGAPVLAYPAERDVWAHELEHLSCRVHRGWALDTARAPDQSQVQVPGSIDQQVADGVRIAVGVVSAEVLHTPDHTSLFIALKVGEELLTGDWLFPNGYGLTSWPLPAFATVIRSVERALGRPDAVLVRPGHGCRKTIGHERPSLASCQERAW